MIFSQYNYKDYHCNNKNEWPLQPPTIENWCKMINGQYKYCADFGVRKWFWFRFWVFVGRLKEWEVPSEHPYWKRQVQKDIKVKLDELILKYEKCKKQPSQIKYLFNSNTTLIHIESWIEDYKKELRV